MMPRVARTLLYSGLAFMVSSLAWGEEPLPPSSSGHHHGAPQSTESTAPAAASQDEMSSEAAHVPPDPPQHPMKEMPYREMADMMDMDDTAFLGRVLLEQLEWRKLDEGDAGRWDAQAWYGNDYNKLWIKTEGERSRGITEDARAELLWDRIIARWWNLQAGARHDFGEGPSRTWAALGVQGLAPYWFDVEATLYVGEQGRTAARLKTEYELLFTQRLILEPELEMNVYGKSDRARALGSGLSDLQLGLRLRYEFRREFAPYVGLVWARRFGETADLARASGTEVSDVQWVAGLRLWF